MIESFSGGKRLAMAQFEEDVDWYVGYSPRNSISHHNFNGASVEGSWEDWVNLAKEILKEDKKRNKKPTAMQDDSEILSNKGV